jgi:hypothetical protein
MSSASGKCVGPATMQDVLAEGNDAKRSAAHVGTEADAPSTSSALDNSNGAPAVLREVSGAGPWAGKLAVTDRALLEVRTCPIVPCIALRARRANPLLRHSARGFYAAATRASAEPLRGGARARCTWMRVSSWRRSEPRALIELG